MNFDHKIYRCEWQIVINNVDQYGNYGDQITVASFPTFQMAFDKLPDYGYQHEFVKERWIPNNKEHDYQILDIQYKEVRVPYISNP